MALIIYPATDWDSYLSVADADAIVESHIYNVAAWTALTNTQKEILLRQASLMIKLKIVDPEEDTTPYDLELATTYLAEYSIGKTMTYSDGKDNLKRLKIDGAIEKEFFTKGATSNSFPSMVSSLLTGYGYSAGRKILRS